MEAYMCMPPPGLCSLNWRFTDGRRGQPYAFICIQSMANTSKNPRRPDPVDARSTVAARRASARQQRESRRQRIVLAIAGGAIGIALLSLLAGVLYDRLFVPSQPVAQVSDTRLSRGDYYTERRFQIARDINNTLALVSRFGDQFGDQFRGQVAQLNAEIDTVSSAPVDDATINNWIDRQVISQGAQKLNLQASDGEVAQLLVTDLNLSFPQRVATPTPAASSAVTTTTVAEATAGAASTTEASAATAAADTTTEATVEPSPTLPATPGVEQALNQEEAVLTRLYDAYSNELTSAQAKPNLSIEDFRQALRDQYRREVLTDKVQAQLVPEQSFTASTEPTGIETRHILIKVEVPETATDSERQSAFAERRADAQEVLDRINDGADFATVAQETSEDLTTRESGGTLPQFDLTGRTTSGTQIDPAFLQAALALKEPNQVSDLVQTPFGWHIIQLVRLDVPTTEDQLQEARTKAFDTWVDEQRAALNIQRFPPQTPTAAPEPTSESAEPLPTAPLGGLPTPITDTTSLTNTDELATSTAEATTTSVPATTAPTRAATTATTTSGSSQTATSATTPAGATTTSATTAPATTATAAP